MVFSFFNHNCNKLKFSVFKPGIFKNLLKFHFEYKFFILYMLFGGLWIKFSDMALSKIVNDAELITKIQTYKGWFYVLITALLFTFILKQHLNKVRNAEQEAVKSDQLKTLFIQNISHEIRTPMNGILGFTNLLASRKLEEDTKNRYLTIIKSCSLQLLSIVNDVLDISLIESGNLELNNHNFNLNTLLDEVTNTFLPNVKPEIKIELTKGLQDPKGMIVSDRVKLQQILNNLINNALKFTEKGSVQIGYYINNNTIEFYIRDTGIGIHENLQPHIFDRFSKNHEGFDKFYQGVGLGLAICKGHLELLKGKIWLNSVEGHGSTFYFAIPYIPAKAGVEIKNAGLTKPAFK